MPKLTEATRDRRRAQIADAALRRFAQSGLAATSMADIIEEANLSAGSIYSHFESKADLVRFASASFLDARLSGVQAQIDAFDAPPSPGRVLELVLRDGIGDRARSELLLQVWAEGQHDEGIAEVAVENMRRITALVRQAIAPWAARQAQESGVEPEALGDDYVDAVITAVQGYVVRIGFDRGLDTAVLLARLSRVLG